VQRAERLSALLPENPYGIDYGMYTAQMAHPLFRSDIVREIDRHEVRTLFSGLAGSVHTDDVMSTRSQSRDDVPAEKARRASDQHLHQQSFLS
jgi:hypothetical protein